jgi:phospholipid transport system substrate-binding protein
MHNSASLVFVFIAATAVATPCARADTTEDPSAVVTGVIGAVQHTIGDATLSVQDREQEFGRLLHDRFDIPAMSRFVLGPYSAGASRQDMDTFAGLFQRWMINAYAGTVGGMGDVAMKVIGTRPDGAAGVVVTSDIPRPDHPPIQIEWRLRQDEGRYKVVDVFLEGISLGLVERAQMVAVIHQNGGTVAGLNQALEHRFEGETGTLAASAGH